MFPKSKRFNKGNGIRKVIETGISIRCSCFVLRYREGNNLHLTIVIGKKADKSAPIRNRIKRIFRAAIQNILKEINITGDLVFFPSISTFSMKSTDLYGDIRNSFIKINNNKWKKF